MTHHRTTYNLKPSWPPDREVVFPCLAGQKTGTFFVWRLPLAALRTFCTAPHCEIADSA
jgi:hypothetical protein